MLADFLKEILQPIVERWIRTVTLWLRRLPFLAQANIVLAAAIVGLTWEFSGALSQWTSLDDRLVRVAVSGRSKPPIARDLRERLLPEIRNRTEQLHAQLRQHYAAQPQPGSFYFTAWTTAEIVAALTDRDIDAAQTIAYFNRERGPGSERFGPSSAFGWAKYGKAGYPPHLDVTSWVLLAFAQLHYSVDSKELEFVLGSQKQAGWWPIYPSSDDERNASCDATAMTIWALHEQLAVGAPDRDKITLAVASGAQWLYSQRSPKTARWRDYPAGRPLLSVSGLALHALHMVGGYDLKDIDRLWLRSLPNTLPRADEYDVSARTVFRSSNDPIQTDDTKYYSLPWAIVATIDAYPNGNIFDRAFALNWLERVIAASPLETLKGDNHDNWVLALNLLALKRL
jgi:hypothetical protein